MELLINEDEYLPQESSSGAGVRVHLGPPGKRPNPADSGFNVRPGSEADLGFTVKTISRMGAPYAPDCWDSWENTQYYPLYYHHGNNLTDFIQQYFFDVIKKYIINVYITFC